MIVLNDFKRQWQLINQDVLHAVEEVGESGWYILGAEVTTFEQSLANYWGRRSAVGVASGLDALEIGLRVLGCKAGDRVLTTPLTAFATTMAIVKLGAVPVFVDVDNSGSINLEAAARVFDERPDIRFFIPVHLYGHALDAAKLRTLRDVYDVRIVEDCAQSIGAKWQGTPAGTIGQVAATSFYPTKNLGALGDGGALLGDDDALAVAARQLRDYGQGSKYKHEQIGYNSRLDELQAAIMARVLLPRLDQWTARRKAIAARYIDGIHNPHIRVLAGEDPAGSVWHLFPVVVNLERKGAFMTHLRTGGVASGEHYPIAVPDQNAMRQVLSESIGTLDNARTICASQVSLPIHPHLEDAEVNTVIDVCNRWEG